tara:strand:+ start:1209 stop:2444 length:1236 start_codon:yes stop_codon:yes gene_type:complete
LYYCENKNFTLSLLDRIKNVFVPQANKVEQRSITYTTPFGTGTTVSADTALTFTAVWSAIRLLTESVSSLPISVYRAENNGDKTEAIKESLYTLLKYKPNIYQNKITFFEKIMMDLCINGNSYVLIERNRLARVTALYPLNYVDMEVIQKENELFYEDGDTGNVYDSKDILHFTGMTSDGIVGLSPIDNHKKSIGWGMAVEEYGSSFFKNGAKLSGVLSTERSLSETAIDRLKHSFNNTYSQLSGSNQTAILEEGLTFKPVGISPDQAQFLASRTFSIQEIGRIWNIPNHMLGDNSKSSFNNIEMQSQEFVTFSLLPYITRIENEMNNKLFRTSDLGRVFIKFNVGGLLRGNTKDRSEFYTKMITNGVMSINEVRALEDLNKIEDGDKHFMQMNMTTIEKIGTDADENTAS